jgi:hypothetical protein
MRGLMIKCHWHLDGGENSAVLFLFYPLQKRRKFAKLNTRGFLSSCDKIDKERH